MSQPPRSVVVVGAGLAGMTAALTAADEGARVTVLEARDSPGRPRPHHHHRRRLPLQPGRARARTAAARPGRCCTAGASRRVARPRSPPARTGCGATAPSMPCPARSRACCGRRCSAHPASSSSSRCWRARPAWRRRSRPGHGPAVDRRHLAPLRRAGGAGIAGPDLDLLRRPRRARRGCRCRADGAGLHAWRGVPRRRLAATGRRAPAAGGGARHHPPHPGQGHRDRTLAPTASPCAPHTAPWRPTRWCSRPADPRDVDTMVRGASAAARRWATDERPVVATTLDVALWHPAGTRPAHHVRPRRADVLLGPHARTRISLTVMEAARSRTSSGTARPMSTPSPGSSGCSIGSQPGWHEQVADWRHGERLVVAHGRPLPGRGLGGRPPVAVPDLPRVYVAGDWVGPDGMLADAAFASGRAAGRAAATAPALVAA